MIDNVVALYVDARGPYPSLVRDWYDEARDARTYRGPWPVVAHPPCGPWSTLRTLSRETTAWCALHALDLVRRFGGVLEHPAFSGLWDRALLPRPGELPDGFGGFALDVNQCDFGHVAKKRSWLYVVGVSRGAVPELPPAREPTHWCSGSMRDGARGKVPPGVKICSANQRKRTPPAFAAWLLELAGRASRRMEAAS